MNRGFLILCAMMAAGAAATLSVRACAEQPAKVEKPASSLSQWQEGTNYSVLPNPQAPGVQGKVVVNEIFWYGCGHCYALDPLLESWKVKKADYIDFVRIPVIWGQVHRQHAKLYYTILALGRGDLHSSVFDAIHMTGNLLAANTDEQARALHLAFLMDHGVTEKAFNDAYDSPQVAANLKRAEELTKTYMIGSVPTMIVNGKYSTGVSQAGGSGALLTLVNDLAASERQRR